MAKRKKHEEHEEHENHERWLVTYADMITLLMVLFIVLFSIGQVDLKKFKELAEGFNGEGSNAGAGVIEGGDGVLAASGTAPDMGLDLAQQALQEKQQREAAAKSEGESMDVAQHQIAEQLAAVGLGDAVHFTHEA